jgi:hypothetical protein
MSAQPQERQRAFLGHQLLVGSAIIAFRSLQYLSTISTDFWINELKNKQK